jgi:HSP20 family molecular chaperone IbpA
MKENKHLEKIDRNDAEPTRDARVFVPTTDIYETEDAILVRCDMPGVTQDRVDIRLENTELEIDGVPADSSPDGLDLLVGEYDTGVFRRKFNVPQLIDRDNIKARLLNGVLDITLPKAEQAKPRKIEITTGE